MVGGITIDQLIANALYDAQATSPKLRTLVLGHPLVITDGNCVQGTIVGTGLDEPVFPLLDATADEQWATLGIDLLCELHAVGVVGIEGERTRTGLDRKVEVRLANLPTGRSTTPAGSIFSS